MIIFIVLLFFLAGSFYVTMLYDTVNNSYSYIKQINRKTQAYHIFESALPVVIEVLKRDDQTVDSLQDEWSYPIFIKNEVGELKVTIYDEQRALNLNYVGERRYKETFERLFKLLNIDRKYIENMLIWSGKKEGTLDLEYPVKKAPFHSKEELLYAGFEKDDLYGKKIGNDFFPGLINFVTVYSSGKININTASLYVIKALDNRIDENLASKIIERRKKEPFKNINELVTVEGFNFDILYEVQDLIDVKSRYFHLVMELKIGDTTATFESVYDRGKNEVVWKKII